MTFAKTVDDIRRVRFAGIVGTASAKIGASPGLTLRKVRVDNSEILARCLSALVNTIAGSTGQMTMVMVIVGLAINIRQGHILGERGVNGLIRQCQDHQLVMCKPEQCTGT